MTIRDVLDNGILRKEITFTVKPAFLKHLEFLARIESNRLGHTVDVEHTFSPLRLKRCARLQLRHKQKRR